MKVSEKLQVARDLLAQGWTAGTLVSKGIDGRVKYCARGALNKAFLGRATSDAEYTPDDELRLAQWLVAAAMNGERFRDEFDDVTVRYAIQHWNDSQRGKACVVAAFDAAIAECKRLEDDVEKALAEEFTMLPVTQGESHQRRDPTLTTTGAPTVRTTRTDRRPHPVGRHRASNRLDRADRLDRPDRLDGPHHADHNDDDTSHHRHRSGTMDPRPPANVARRRAQRLLRAQHRRERPNNSRPAWPPR